MVTNYSRRVVRVGLTNGVLGRVEGSIAGLSTVDDHNLSVGHQDELRHNTRLQHVFDLPTFLDTFVGDGHTTALVGGGIFWGEFQTRSVGISGRATADEDLRDVVGRVEREKTGGTVEGVGDRDTVGNVRKRGFCVLLDIVDDDLASGNNEDPAIRESNGPGRL